MQPMKAIVHTSGARTVGNYLLPFYPLHTPFVNIEVVSFQKIRGRYPKCTANLSMIQNSRFRAD